MLDVVDNFVVLEFWLLHLARQIQREVSEGRLGRPKLVFVVLVGLHVVPVAHEGSIRVTKNILTQILKGLS